ncbi:MAG TPA: PfkB family carbohydrate kinase [Jiangellaceae bacterium]|nr:PfkB family carbohydrate kinase [Jiangellaceae bacterium]
MPQIPAADDAGAAARLDLLAVGQIFLDVLYGPLPSAPMPGQEIFTPQVTLVPGGIANFALAGTALGARTGVVASCGEGPLGDLAISHLAAAGVETAHLQRYAAADLQLTTALSYDGERALITGGAAPESAAVPAAALVESRAVAVHLELAEMPWLEHAPGAVFADVGWDPTGHWDRAILRHLEHCAAFLPNAAEAQAYTGADDPSSAARALAERTPLVVVTCGAEGAIAVDSAHGTEVSVDAVDLGPVDPTGAGDTFGAALITLLGAQLPLRDAVEGACLAATARAAGVAGPARTPQLNDLVALAERHGLASSTPLAELASRSPQGVSARLQEPVT